MNLVINGIYKINARNFNIGIYLGNNSFIGLRYKLGLVYPDIEHLGMSIIGKPIYLEDFDNSLGIQLSCFLPAICKNCGINTKYVKDLGTIHLSPTNCSNIESILQPNNPLIKYLEELNRKYKK